ncbi:endo-1,4-beta-xylanase [Prevotella copri]|uniref:endo-1,4-beta-xylanase n=2 Tax=Prevotellaceae TaxID=171552 RepID=A0AAW4N8W9_9BACT|nr:endo-1,4-beta-xylanase [Segatella copri]MBU9910681.1 endo-1,4-beta-xylanase [Segatella copri]MBV3398231.1 endo-1,4-beta-xylanase [Segatella copri]MBV3407882.1 endo-1,4-beta-xylanase [Segatella copri]MBV3410683.1 endo-1,4-beta-xylanase [Segatella copri]MBV3419116.1 endo-1,4-beta-xylanase [Segatella copri]
MNKQILVSALGAMLLASCADHFDQNFETVRPGKEAQYGYLEQYDALKEYIKDRPNFHLGIGTAVDEYNKKELVYALTNSNFNETVAGNAMKMSSCVADDGSMDFDKVKEYVKNATDAGLSVYGHTLAWHSQQPNKYLKRLIADKELPPAENNPGLIITSGDPKAETYDYEIDYDLDEPLKAGKTYEISLNVRGTNPGTIDFWPEKKGGSATQYGAGSFTVAESAVPNSFTFTPNADVDHLRFCFGKVGGTLYFDNFILKEEGSDHNLVVNSTFDENDISHWTKPSWIEISYKIGNVAGAAAVDIENEVHKRTYTDGPFPFLAMGCEPPVVNGAIHFVPTGDWSQFFVMSGGENKLSEEGNYVVYLDITSSKDASGVELTMQNGWDKNSNQQITVSVPVSAGRQTVKLPMPNVVGGDYDIILKPQTADATLDVHSVKVCQVKKSNTKPLTPEEKKEALTPVLQNWIYGMMAATEGKVKAWDVVNEALSGADKDGDGKYDLQHAATASADDAKNNFYWQDYLGDIDYVRTAVAAARKGFVDAGGKPEELKLFINDYNLEYDKNQKLESLIHWINEWEKDGTVIDGIGSQMHVSCSMDPVEQKKREDAYVNMLNLMVGSHKLVRISELDMGLEDKNGNLVKTTDMTEEQHKAMRAYYEFIVKKYLEIVPKDQQWGICQWCATDSPANSGWRAGLPVGLWDSDYYRKHTYGGFAAGLGAPEYWKEAK